MGRPRTISSPDEFDARADAYFDACTAAAEPILFSGLILALGLEDRRTLDRYQERPEFGPAVKRAKLRVAQGYERRLHLDRANPAGAIFALKNMDALGWTDRMDVQAAGILAAVDVTKLRDDQLARLVAGENPLTVLGESLPAGLLTRGERPTPQNDPPNEPTP